VGGGWFDARSLLALLGCVVMVDWANFSDDGSVSLPMSEVLGRL
jgi:hypothetical protein